MLDDNDSGTVGIAEVLGHMDEIRQELGSGGVNLKYPKNVTELTKVSSVVCHALCVAVGKRCSQWPAGGCLI